MTAVTTVTTTTVSIDVTASNPITSITQSTLQTLTTTPIVAESKTSATLDISATKTITLDNSTKSLPVNTKLSAGLTSQVKDTLQSEAMGTLKDGYDIYHNTTTLGDKK